MDNIQDLMGVVNEAVKYNRALWAIGCRYIVSSTAFCVTIQSHTHTVTIPAHTHTVNIPNHTHPIEHGIFRTGNPTSAQVSLLGSVRATIGRTAELDITPWLLNTSNKVPRGSWIKLGVKPNDLAYITIDLMVQGFVQSRGGGNY